MSEKISVITSKKKFKNPNIIHGFFTRKGGESKGMYSSLNCSLRSKDNFLHVNNNRKNAMEFLSLQTNMLLTPNQVHGKRVLVLKKKWRSHSDPKADAIVTKKSGLVLGILTADCAPVILCDEKAKVIGIAHAGWKGVFLGVLESAVNKMENIGAKRSNIKAIIGPCISKKFYEVGNDLFQKFVKKNPKNKSFFTVSKKHSRYMFDLVGCICEILKKLNIGNVENLSLDTFSNPKKFFSYRRSIRKKENDFGRNLSVITLKNSKHRG